MTIYVFTAIFFLLNLGVYNPLIAETTAVKANYSIMPKGAPCPECGGMNVHIEPGYTTEWQDYEGIACIHGYQTKRSDKKEDLFVTVIRILMAG